MKKLVLFLIVLFFAAGADATTYYVATTGSDSNTTAQAQNPATPWLTLQKANSSGATGDTVHVAEGTYVENESSLHVWFVSKGITWVADGPVTVTSNVAGTSVLTINTTATASWTGSWTFDGEGAKTNGVIYSTGSTGGNFTFATPTIKNPALNSDLVKLNDTFRGTLTLTSPTFSSTQAVAHGVNDLGYGVVTISNGTATISGRSLYTGSVNSLGVLITGGTYTWGMSSNLDWIKYQGTGNIEVSGVTATLSNGGAAPGTVFQNYGAATTGTIAIKHNTFNLSAAATAPIIKVATGAHATTIRENSITVTANQTQSTILVQDQPSPIITGNTVDVRLSTSGVTPISVKSTGTEVGAAQVTDNIVYGSTNRSSNLIIQVGTDTSGVGDNKINGAIITGNTVYCAGYYDGSSGAITTHGIEYGHNGPGVVSRNQAIGCGYGIVVKGCGQDFTNGNVSYNLVRVLGGDGSSAIRVKGVINENLYNNTMAIETGGTVSDALMHITNNTDADCIAQVASTGTTLRNNIMYGARHISVDAGSAADLDSDYNSFFPATAITSIVGANSYSSVSAYKTGSGLDAHSFAVDPLFVDAAAGNYRLQSTSPLINGGVTP